MSYFQGMIDSNGYKQLDDAANEFIEAAESNNWPKAMDTSNMIEYLMQKLTYGVDRYTVIKKVSPKYSPSMKINKNSLIIIVINV